ncbi:LamG domain-containing protein [Peristeroidobacter agariperforans]|uniref:LamG domain-containing protein n=1 Tax=Peristeroidobacter agariperforans TaxID=268404 RepID=UPI0018E52D4E|nr:LamG domain-containing protein [Peristeroidobacter agariperforans]
MSINSIKKQMRILAALGALALAGCSGGSSTEQNPVPAPPNVGADYVGPAAANDDIQAFRNEFWNNIRTPDRCGGCHNATGQAPSFARSDDVNQAYQQTTGIVNRENPSLSLLVTKVAGGHNCWRGDPAACASDLTRWITAWVGATGTGGKQITLLEPELVNPTSGKRLPAVRPANFNGVYALLNQHCSGCHQSNSATAQQPFFAADNIDEAYLAAIPKINLNAPEQSRFVVRLFPERHNCWTDDCETDAQTMLEQIQILAAGITAAPPPDGVLSKALTLYDGTVAAGGNRYEANMIALYEFKTGSGNIAYDTSGVAPTADLELSVPGIEWVGGWGINIRSGRAKTFGAASRKFNDLIKATGEYSIEAWVVPGNVTQEDARIVSYSGSTDVRNFTMGQNLYNYEFAARSSETDANGMPRLITDDDAERLQASLQHVVMTFDPVNGRRIYVNGEFTGDVDGSGGGSLESWDNTFALYFGNEASGDRQWQGVIRLAAIYNRALNLQQIKQNFEAGVGQKFFLLFGVSHVVDMPRAYIMFEATQYDSYGYLFTNPKFISLDAAAMPGSIPLQSMRIGVNGAEAEVGQAYRLLDLTINDQMYSAATGQLLSSVGTIIPAEQGPEFDQFFLCFDKLGAQEDFCTQYTPGIAIPRVGSTGTSDIGVKLFDAINATMASITGVDPNNADIKRSYNNVRQSLPAVHDLQGYLSSHQTAVAQLALQYCNVLVNTQRSSFFPGVDFSADLTQPGGSGRIPNANGQAVLDTLYYKMIGTAASQLSDTDFMADVGGLMGTLCSDQACSGQRTADVVKAACGAALGNAATLVE